MNAYLLNSWWHLLMRGLALLFLGFFAVVFPGLTLYGFALGAAVYFIVTGVLNAITSLGAIGRLPLWFLQLVLGGVEIAVGVYALKHLTLTVATLILLIGLVFVVRGIIELISAFGDGYEPRQRSILAILGVLSLVAGIVTWLYPASSGLAFTWVVGVYGLVAGAFLISMSLEHRQIRASV